MVASPSIRQVWGLAAVDCLGLAAQAELLVVLVLLLAAVWVLSFAMFLGLTDMAHCLGPLQS